MNARDNTEIRHQELPRRSWFALGGRHGVANRVSDVTKILSQFPSTNVLTALDIGAAEGDISVWLRSRYAHVYAIEAMSSAYEQLAVAASQHDNLTAEQADVRTYTASNKYDHAFFLGVLHYFRDDALKLAALRMALSLGRDYAFVRTGIREHKVRYGLNVNQLQKYTPLSVFRCAGEDGGFQASIADNASRGQQEPRLGNLVVFRRKDCESIALDAALAHVESQHYRLL